MRSCGKNLVGAIILLELVAALLVSGAAFSDSPTPVAVGAKSTLATDVDPAKLDDARLDGTKPDAAKPGLSNSAAAGPDVAVTDLDDVAEPLVPKRERSEADQDRLQATALFAAARTNEQRQEFPLALRQYERALRCDTSAKAALSEIVALAFNLDRRAEAARYAEQIVPRNVEDATMLRRLGIELAEEGDWAAALKLYEKVAAIQPVEKPSANTVLWWMETGRLYYLTKQYTAAAKQFAHVAEALQRPAEFGLNETLRKAVLGSGDMTYQLFGECFLDAGETAAARKAFEKSNSLKENAPLLTYNLARVAAKDKQPEQVLEKLDEYFKSHRSEEGTGPCQLLAAALEDLGRKNELIARLEKLRADDADNTPLTYFLAEQFRQAGQLDKAEALYRKLCEPQTRRPPIDAYQALVTLLHEQSRWDDLFALLGDALAKTGGFDPLGAAGKKLLADDAAVQALLAVAKKQKQAGAAEDSHGPWLTAALLAMECKQFADANEYFERAVKAGTKKTAELTLTWGLELLAASQFEDSIKVFRRGIDEHVLPAENPAFHFYLAGALAMAGETDGALAEARRAADLQPDSARFQSRIGWILYHAKKNDEARKVYEDFVKRFDGNHESADTRDVLHDARLVLSNIDVAQGHMAAAEEWIEQVLDEYPADVGALNDLGYLWADENKHLERALRMVQEAVAAEPKNLAYRDSLGWAYYRLHRYADAVTELQIATAVEKPDGVVLDHLGDALFAQGDGAAAVASWTKALAAFDKEGDKPKSKQTQDKIDRANAKPS